MGGKIHLFICRPLRTNNLIHSFFIFAKFHTVNQKLGFAAALSNKRVLGNFSEDTGFSHGFSARNDLRTGFVQANRKGLLNLITFHFASLASPFTLSWRRCTAHTLISIRFYFFFFFLCNWAAGMVGMCFTLEVYSAFCFLCFIFLASL